MENHIRNHRLNRLVMALAFCAGILLASRGYAQTCAQRITAPLGGYGMGVDTNGQIWVSGMLDYRLYRYSANGQVIDEFFTGFYGQYGVAVTPVDDNVWVAVGGFKEVGGNKVLRFDNAGNLLEVIPIELNSQVANSPNAVAVDANGVVWVTSKPDVWVTSNGYVPVAKIYPIADPVPADCATTYDADACSRVISVVDIDWPYAQEDYAKPDNYSDMTGMVTLLTTGTGTWTTVHDGGVYGAAWTTVTWIGDPSGPQPAGTSLKVAVRAADTELELTSATYQEGIINGGEFVDVWGRYIQVRVRFRGTCPGTVPFATPVLSDLQVAGVDRRDCNHNNIDDACDIDCGVTAGPCDVLGCGGSADCNGNGIPDECEIDRNSTAPDGPFFCRGLCDPDCNYNGIPDVCDIAYCMGDPDCEDCDLNGVPDWCDPDCQPNGVPDGCDIDGMISEDCDENGIPDECQDLVIGTCCTAEDVCEDPTSKGCCEAEGGQFLGEYTTCEEVNDVPGVAYLCGLGACCVGGGSCTETELSECADENEYFRGYGSTCDPNCCHRPETGHDWCQYAPVTQLHLPNECHDDNGSPLEPAVPCDPANGNADCQPIPCTGDEDCPNLISCDLNTSLCFDTLAMTCEQSFVLSSSVSLTGDSSQANAGDCENLKGDRVWWEAFRVDACEGCDDCEDCDNCAFITMDFGCTNPPLTAYYAVLYDTCACGLGISADTITVEDGNPTLTWTLPPGTYYYPIPAGDNGLSGPYQFQVKTTRCSIAACCRWQEACTEENRPTCDALGGNWLGGGDQPIVTCQAASCSFGVCCMPEGICKEDEFSDEEPECTAQGGTYRGGTTCNDFTCPVEVLCDVTDAAQCKPAGGDLFVLSDLGACTRVADDFYLLSDDVNDLKVCWRGVYHDFGVEPTGVAQISTRLVPSPHLDCSGTYGDDKFLITFYGDTNGVPGAVLLSEAFNTGDVGLESMAVAGGLTYEYTARLSTLLPLSINTPYWLEIQNDNGGNGTCYWMWESSRKAYNSVSAWDDDINWESGDVRVSADQTMCLIDTNDPPFLEPFDGPSSAGACCFDGTGECTVVYIYECDGAYFPDENCSSPDSLCEFACCLGAVCNDKTASACTADGGLFTPGVVCADADGEVCAGACAQGTRCCYDVDAGPGCGEPSCCTSVCAFDSYCCETEWDQLCASEASEAFDKCDPNLMKDCLVSPIAAPEPHNIRKNRYISFDPNHDPNNPKSVAFRVSLTASQWHEGALGVLGWVSAPDPTNRATIGPARVDRVWSEQVIHVGDCHVAPIATYDIATILMGADETHEDNYSDSLSIETSLKPGAIWWGDCVGFFNGVEWSPPQGTMNFDDVVAAIKTFQNPSLLPGCGTPPCNATHVSVTDIEPQVLNRLVNINDVLLLILAFKGDEYPFGCPDDPCWDTITPIEDGGDGPCPGGSSGGGGGGSAPLGPATLSTLSLVPSSDLILQGELIDVEVFLDVADDLGGYQLDVEVTGGSTGSLNLENLFIDDTHTDISGTPDYVFLGVSSQQLVSSFWGQIGAVNLGGVGIPVTGPAYLGTFQFRASADAVGVFTIRFADIENNFLMNGQAGRITDAIADDEAFIGVEVECAVDSHCDDSNACTDDACNNGTCVYTNDDTNTCSDGNDCTDDACSSGTCVSTNDDSNTCTDGNDCTADSCLSGVCTSTNEPGNTACDDGLFCTKTDKCDGAGTCVGSGDPCTGRNPYCCETLSTCTMLPCI